MDVFPPKRISPDCPFKSNHGLTKISILTPQCDAHAELDSAERCTLRSLTPPWDANHFLCFHIFNVFQMHFIEKFLKKFVTYSIIFISILLYSQTKEVKRKKLLYISV